jgi:hypothetical protein
VQQVLVGITEGERERDRPLGGSERKGKDILKWNFKKPVGAWTGFVWFRIGTGKQTFVKAVMNLWAHKMRGIS